MDHKINASIQIIPKSENSDIYALVDKAILVIRNSGLKHIVTPMETIVEGTYEEVMDVFRKANEAVLPHADELIVFIKLHINASRDVTFEEKTHKWS